MMKRLLALLRNELVMTRTTLSIHLLGFFQPALMFSLMAFVLVMPTFELYVARSSLPLGESLVEAMVQVNSPIGDAYIEPLLVEWQQGDDIPGGQVVELAISDGMPTAVQHFDLIDSNIVKNYRNRLTSAGLILWEEELGRAAIQIEERPLLPVDVPYNVYFGMGMLPLAAWIGASFVAAFLSAQEFEFKTIQEYRLAPAHWGLVLGARLLRLSLTGLLSSMVLMITLYVFEQAWPSPLGLALGMLVLMGLIGACVGTSAALVLKQTLPSFVIALASAFFTWIMGGAFGLPAGFGGVYEAVSRWVPNSYAVRALFPLYYPIEPSHPNSYLILFVFATAAVIATILIYRKSVLSVEEVRQ